jgi:hypothetical protein
VNAFDRAVSVALITSLVFAGASGAGLFAAALGIRASSGWRHRWGVWLPSLFGASVAAIGISMILLLLPGK